MIESLLVANRGEIARRIIRTAKRLGDPHDRGLLRGRRGPAVRRRGGRGGLRRPGQPGAELPQHRGDPRRRQGDRRAGDPPRLRLPLRERRVRPYRRGQRPDLGRPGADAITAMGDKINARNLMAGGRRAGRARHHRPGRRPSTRPLAAAADDRLPGHGQGRGRRRRDGHGASPPTRRRCAREYEKVRAFAERMFGDGSVLIERYFPRVRHVEVQILGLADGRVVALGERECSVQRRNQKLVEESPSPAVVAGAAGALPGRGGPAGEAVGYRNAGTVECLLDPATGEFFFLEMNTRLQVEHPITEAVYGIDLVEEQLRVASGAGAHVRPGRARRRAATRSSCGSTPRTRSASCPARARSRPGWSRPARASGSTPATPPAPRSRRSTTR